VSKKKLKIVKCTTQELEAVCTLLSGVEVKVVEGKWIFDMYDKFKKAFDDAAKTDPDYEEVETEEING
jgi:hypothetical protein|tara:strand:- start:122 stop:325 length:204 start_codon:yes stop_codon:yes gene_type:complete